MSSQPERVCLLHIPSAACCRLLLLSQALGQGSARCSRYQVLQPRQTSCMQTLDSELASKAVKAYQRIASSCPEFQCGKRGVWVWLCQHLHKLHPWRGVSTRTSRTSNLLVRMMHQHDWRCCEHAKEVQRPHFLGRARLPDLPGLLCSALGVYSSSSVSDCSASEASCAGPRCTQCPGCSGVGTRA